MATFKVGQTAEQSVYQVLRQYTKHVYTNVRVDTLLTKKRDTEIDILAALADILLVVEVKNISAVEGTLDSEYWKLTGFEAGQSYSHLNVFTQNRIHVRSLKDAWLAKYKEIPAVVSVVVVPNGCSIPQEIADVGVLDVQTFGIQIAEIAAHKIAPKYGYALDFTLAKDKHWIIRSDFEGR